MAMASPIMRSGTNISPIRTRHVPPDPPNPTAIGNNGGGPVSRSIWYSFTPANTANYTIATCAAAPTGSTVDDTVIGVYTSTGGCSGPFAQVPGGCDDDSCTVEIIYYPLFRPEIGENPNWRRDYAYMNQYLHPTAAENWDEKMRADLIAELRNDGIEPDKLTDKQLVTQVSRWLMQRSHFTKAFAI